MQQTGGSFLLGRSQDWDWALLRLNSAPPGGVSFRGWDADDGSRRARTSRPSTTRRATSRSGARAHVRGNSRWTSAPRPAGGTFTRVVWEQGTTEGGSSGGSLLSYDGRDTTSCAAGCSAATRCAATPTAATSTRSSARCSRWCAST